MFNKFIFILVFLPIMAFSEDFIEIYKIENPTELDRNRFYVQPECFFVTKLALPGVGMGYRFHENRFGFDASIHGFPVSICSSWGLLPFLKGLLLLYPYKQGFYLGIGADIGIMTGPLLAIGYELLQKDRLFLFIQLDGCYTITFNQPVASLALGVGF